jgi:hypothetical protein
MSVYINYLKIGDNEIVPVGKKVEVEEFYPPDPVECPYWEFSLKDGTTIMATGDVILIVESDTVTEVEERPWGKITRIKRKGSQIQETQEEAESEPKE